MNIENRQRTIQTGDGSCVISEYRYKPMTVPEAVPSVLTEVELESETS